MDKKKMIQLLSGLAVVFVCGILYFHNSPQEASNTVITEGFSDTVKTGQGQENGSSTEKPGREDIYIHVCGQVKKPGVYVFTGEPRVIEAIEKAGGFTKKADRSSLNQAAVVTDGTQLMIPAKTVSKTVSDSKKTSVPKAGANQSLSVSDRTLSVPDRTLSVPDRVNINTASKEELMTLSGIGESKASQILSYREENGYFKKTEDIMNISGIKEGVFGKIKDKITV